MNIDETKEISENLQNCNHEWDFLITLREDGNLFTEKCLKCFVNINTLEIFPK